MTNLLPLNDLQLRMLVGRLPLVGPSSPATCVAEVGSWRPAADDGSEGPAARPPRERVTFERYVAQVDAPADDSGAPRTVHVWRYVGPVRRDGRADLAGALQSLLGRRCHAVAVTGDDEHPTVTLDVANP